MSDWMGDIYDAEPDEENQTQSQNQSQQQPNQAQTQSPHYGDNVSDISDEWQQFFNSYPTTAEQPSEQINDLWPDFSLTVDPSLDATGQPAGQAHYQQVVGTNTGAVPDTEKMTLNNQQLRDIEMGYVNMTTPLAPTQITQGGVQTQLQPDSQSPSYAQLAAEQPAQEGGTGFDFLEADCGYFEELAPSLAQGQLQASPQVPSYAPPATGQPQQPTEQEIMNNGPGVQIGETRYPNLAAAIALQKGRRPRGPRPNEPVYGSGARTWIHNMVDRYPYYDDGPRAKAKGEQKSQFRERVMRARTHMGVITRQEPPKWYPKISDESPDDARIRRDKAKWGTKKEEDEHKRKITTTSTGYDANYTRIWLAQRERIRAHNAHQRSYFLQARRAFDLHHNRPAGPDPIAPDDGGNNLYSYTFYLPHPQPTNEPLAAIKRQARYHSFQYTSPPTFQRCKECKRRKKGCDLSETGFPCTLCGSLNILCEDCDDPLPFSLRWKGAKNKPTNKQSDTSASTLGMSMAFDDDDDGDDDDTSLAARRPRRSRRDELPSRTRSASPERPSLSEPCDNCKLYGTLCEETRPCNACILKGLSCNECHQDNDHREPPSGDAGLGGCVGCGGYGGFGMGYGYVEELALSPLVEESEYESYDDFRQRTGGPGPSNMLDEVLDFDNAFDFVARLGESGLSNSQQTRDTMNSYAVITEPAPSSIGRADSLAPFAEQRRLVDPNTGIGEPFELPLRPPRTLRSAARSSAAYNEPAKDEKKYFLRSTKQEPKYFLRSGRKP